MGIHTSINDYSHIAQENIHYIRSACNKQKKKVTILVLNIWYSANHKISHWSSYK